MKSTTIKSFLGILIFGVSICLLVQCDNAQQEPEVTEEEPTASSCDDRYASFEGNIPPKSEYEGPLYYLGQKWPKTLPVQTDKPWSKFESLNAENVKEYMLTMRNYVYKDLIPADFRMDKVDWYTIPFQPREAIRGMYDGNNQPALSYGAEQKIEAVNFTTGFYNNVGGYTIGQVFGQCDRDTLDPYVTAESVMFNEGTIVIKLAMTSLPVEQAPVLAGAYEWQIYADTSTREPDSKISRTAPNPGQEYNPVVTNVRLMQMDIILKDSKLGGEPGWVFGTLAYDNSVTAEEAKANGWDGNENSLAFYKMVPVGAQNGNDPGITGEDVENGATLKETWLSPDIPDYTLPLLGWAGRLSGPIDGAQGNINSVNFEKDPYHKGANSSCMSCHGAAMYNIKDLHANDSVFNVPLLLPVGPGRGTQKAKLAYMQNNPGSVGYCTTDDPYWAELGCGPTIGEDWIGLDYDYVMFKGIYHAQLQGANKPRPTVETFH